MLGHKPHQASGPDFIVSNLIILNVLLRSKKLSDLVVEKVF